LIPVYIFGGECRHKSLVDITPLPAEDETMDPASKQYIDSSLATSAARGDAKLAEFRAVMEAYSARAEEREAAAREREAAAREREAAARERENAYRERDDIRHRDLERRMAQFEATVASVKRAVITTGIAATLSTVLGVAAFNAAHMQNIFAAVELGRQATPGQIKMQADIDEIKRQLAELRAAKVR
jgi:hypothetical protein